MRIPLFLISIALLSGIGCTDSGSNEVHGVRVEGSPTSSQLLTKNELDLFLAKASSGDVAAMKRVQLHYMSIDNSEAYLHWLEVEAVITPDAKQRLAAYLMNVGGAGNCIRARTLLEAALRDTKSPEGRLVIENQMHVLRGEMSGVEGCK